jgi:Uma2 family endonuclease
MATELAEKPTMSRSTEGGDAAPQEYRWTADRFYRAAAAGVFDDPGRLELIQGRIIEKMPQSPLHRATRIRIGRLLQAVLPPPLEVADECPIHIAFDGEPVPDIVALRGASAEDPIEHPAPENVALLVEIAISSVDTDISEKALLYSQAGIVDYWVVLPERRQIVVHRDPTPDGYASVTVLESDAAVSPLAVPEAALAVHDLLGD